MKTHPDWSAPMSARDRADRKIDDGVIAHQLDPNVVYPFWLEKLGYSVESPTQGQVEIARICATTYLKRLARFVGYVEEKVTDPAARAAIFSNPRMVDPREYRERPAALWLHWTKDARWVLSKFQKDVSVVGVDVNAAVPHTANAEYNRLRREGKVEL
jgi:hypothetical protein